MNPEIPGEFDPKTCRLLFRAKTGAMSWQLDRMKQRE
jgi:hypothetical protein